MNIILTFQVLNICRTRSPMALLVAGIDLGTTFSGWAYSLKHDFDQDPTKINTKPWNSGSFVSPKGMCINQKYLCILSMPSDSFSSHITCSVVELY